MSNIKNRLKQKIVQNKENTQNNFSTFNVENIEGNTRINSALVKLSELIDSGVNVRTVFDADEIEALANSIGVEGYDEHIKVYHVLDSNTYYLADGHRRKMALEKIKEMSDEEFEKKYKKSKLDVMGEEFVKEDSVRVIIDREFDTFNTELRLLIKRKGFKTSNLKEKLTFGEELEQIKEYLKERDELDYEKYPNKYDKNSEDSKKHPNNKLCGKDGDGYYNFEMLGYKRRNAFYLQNAVEDMVKPEYAKLLKDSKMNKTMYQEFSKITNEKIKEIAAEMIRKQEIETTSDIKEFNEIGENVTTAVPVNITGGDKIIKSEAKKKFKEHKKEKEKNFTENEKNIKEFEKIIKKTSTLMIKLGDAQLTKEEKEKFKDLKFQLENIISINLDK